MVTSLCRISAPLTLATTGFASCAKTGWAAIRTIARHPVATVENRLKRTAAVVRVGEAIMDNPFL
jgi:hypothetical protein